MAAKILITGATGTVGSNIVKALSDKGVPVRAALHTAGKAGRIKGPGIELAEVDYGKKETIQAALKGIEALYLLTPFVKDQVGIAVMLIEAAKKAGARRIVKQSGMGADAEPGITVGRLHREIEVYIEKSGVPYTILRPNFFMQNFINYFGASIKAEGKIYLPLGEGKVSYIDARDIAVVAAEVLTKSGHEGKTYTLTGPEALSLHQAAGTLSEVTGRRITYVDVPEEGARSAMRSSGLPEWNVNSLMELHGICKAGFASAVTKDVEDVTGKRPNTFGIFARDHREFFK